jgi:hypothetical protein
MTDNDKKAPYLIVVRFDKESDFKKRIWHHVRAPRSGRGPNFTVIVLAVAILAGRVSPLPAQDRGPELSKEDVVHYPQENKSPQRFFRLTGTVDPEMHWDLVLRWGVSRGHCYELWSVDEVVMPIRSGNSYEINIPLDGKQPGVCGWRPDILYFRGGNTFTSDIVRWIPNDEFPQYARERSPPFDSVVRNEYCRKLWYAPFHRVCDDRPRIGPIEVATAPGSAEINFIVDPEDLPRPN